MSKKIKAVARGVMRHMAEHKYNDLSSLTDVQLNSAVPNVLSPCLMATGTGVGTRVGKQISAASLHLRAWLWNANTASVPALVRVIVFRSIGQDFGTIPVIGDILTSSASGNALVTSPQSPESKGAYHILRDRVYEVDYRNRQLQYINLKVKLGGGKVEYLGNTNGIGDASTGHYYVFLLTNLASGGTSSVSFNYYCRLYYTDA